MPTSRAAPRCPLNDLGERGIHLTAKDASSNLDSTSLKALVADVAKDAGFEGAVDIVIRLDTDPEFAVTSLSFIPSVIFSDDTKLID